MPTPEKPAVPATPPTRHLVVGLGRPGKLLSDRYCVGAQAVAHVATGAPEQLGSFVVHQVPLEGAPCYAAYERQSASPVGPRIAELLRALQMGSQKLVVLYEDLENLELGLLRVRTKGHDTSHPGMGSIISALRTANIARVRIGIGVPGVAPAAVPGAFGATELERLPAIFQAVWEAVRLLSIGQVERVMSIYNRRDRTVDGRPASPHRLPDGRMRGDPPPRRPRGPRGPRGPHRY